MKRQLPFIFALLALIPQLRSVEPSSASISTTPKFSPGPEYADSARMFQGVAGIERAANGRLWATWYGGGVTEDLHNYILLDTSGDDGRTWQRVMVLDPDNDGPVRAFDPCLWHDPEGRLWLFWAQETTLPKGRDTGGFITFAITTTDSGKADAKWSAPRQIAKGVMMNKPTVTKDGRWLLPMATWSAEASARVVVSMDRGATFAELGEASIPDRKSRSADEHMIVERMDGSLWMLVRGKFPPVKSDYTGIGESVSTNGGKTWSDVTATSIPHSGTRFFIRKLTSGRLLLVRQNPPGGKKDRSHLSAFLSEDDGLTWKGGLLLDERLRVSYPDGVQAPDGSIYLIYDHERGGPESAKEILMAVITEADVLAGKLTSPKSRLRLLVNKATGQQAAEPDKPKPAEPLWLSDRPVPKAAELSGLKDVKFHVIKANEPEKDGYKWLHGVALAWHKGKLYASFGHNKGAENTTGEEARGCVSSDGGKTWGKTFTIATPDEPDLGISHGVFLSRGGELWAFQAAFYGSRLTDIAKSKVHTRAYKLNEETGTWEGKGTVIEGGFWPMQEPLKMGDGNWIMSGLSVGNGHPGAVAISHGDDLTKWDLVRIPRPPHMGIWGESTLILDGKRVQNFARINSAPPRSVLTAVSEDYGRTWTDYAPSNLPMVGSKPYTGTLSTGQPYLVCTTTAEAETGRRRDPLTIAVGKPGENGFRKVYRIRGSLCPESPGDSHPQAGLCYPYAVEHDGALYVGFSNSGARGRNENVAELAVIPIASLDVDAPEPPKPAPASAQSWPLDGIAKPKMAGFPLWDESGKLAAAKELPVLDGVEFHIIKKWDKPADGYTFLHGVSLAWHKGKLYASIGHNKGEENTVTEQAQYRVSEDGGRTWSGLRVIDAGEEKDLAVSHGVFASHAGKLWAFHGAYYNKMQRIHTRAYALDEATGRWVKHGVVIENGFWALNQPVKMSDGNWIMAGISAGVYSDKGAHPAAVAISHGDDFTRWDFVRIPVHPDINMWGESGVIVDGANVLNISRYGGKALALISRSQDYGRTWSTMGESNLPMATSKPAAGMLSTGQRYLVCTTAANNGGRRVPLTIAVSKPGEKMLSRIFVIRHAESAGGGESNARASLSYPCATEHEGRLYVGYSNNGGRRGNLNSAELAVIPLEALRVE